MNETVQRWKRFDHAKRSCENQFNTNDLVHVQYALAIVLNLNEILREKLHCPAGRRQDSVPIDGVPRGRAQFCVSGFSVVHRKPVQ
ncbi:hypothetical protein DM39_4770 [Burkholderia cenocepacia]|uniref:Uncharacterized protein n=1 Tax=Burkholderia cenocepacia TaxID=95486 RepID=A0AAN0RZJ1_9BURK|nr:hypothetical protein DM39_4770 [Burkholderia cenocepacia]